MDVVIADRLQFAFTIMFHYLFPITTMGLAPFVAWFTWRAYRTRDPIEAAAAEFWTKLFTIGFAIGVVSGIPMEFQFGTNWAAFAARAGSVVGQPLSMEAIYAFFLESVFLGALFYRRRAVPSAFQAVAAVLVWLGSWTSGFFIVATDAWMQHPVAYTVARDGSFQMGNLWAVLASPFAFWQYTHVISGALVTGGFIVSGIGAYYLLSQRNQEYGRRFLRVGVVVALVFSVMSTFPTGDQNSKNVTQFQPIKLAAMEGLFETKDGAPLAIIGMPDVRNRQLIDPIVVPGVLSFLAYGNFTANVKGLRAYAHALWPPVELTYYAYHVMVGLGSVFAAIAVVAALLLWRNKLFRMRWLLWILMLAMPFPYVANEAGWVVTEVGRQPWIVYGLMRTNDAVSPTVVSGETIFTIIGFVGMYFILGLLYLYLVLREIGQGPASTSLDEGTVEAVS